MPREFTEEMRAWLVQRPSLAELREAFPAEWAAVQRDIGGILSRGEFGDLKTYVAALSKPSRAVGGRDSRTVLSTQVRSHMAGEVVRTMAVSAATGVTEGTVRFNRFNGSAAQRLLFEQGLERKPVSLRWFRFVWPLLRQRRFLMPLVQPKGIYCFYSRALVRSLATLIGGRSCVEIAAGDGTLSRFLTDEGVAVTATDDYSWRNSVQYTDTVLRQDAREALRRHRPEVVLCSWPPAGNRFERLVFRTPSVQLYIVISSRHEFASGNWDAYREQARFTFAEDPSLSRLVLPPEIDPAVYVFRRETEPRRDLSAQPHRRYARVGPKKS